MTYNLFKASKFRLLIYGFFGHYLLALFSVVLMLFTDTVIVNIFHGTPITETRIKSGDLIHELGIVKGVILATVLAPILEEVAFRLFICTKRVEISVSLSTLFFFVSGPVWYIDSIVEYIGRIILSIFIGYIIYRYSYRINIRNLFMNHKRTQITISSLAFAIIHIGNFDPIQYNLFYLYPIYILPQFFLGIILGWIRVKNGFLWAILLHVLINGSITWPKLFSLL